MARGSRSARTSAKRAHLVESRAIAHAFASPDGVEGVVSFLEKRPPAFAGSANSRDDMPAFYPWWSSINVDHPFGGPNVLAKL